MSCRQTGQTIAVISTRPLSGDRKFYTPIPRPAIHIAIAAVHGMDFLLTSDRAHIANAAARGRIEQVVRRGGYLPPVLCTPEELGAD
jgi:hypothetical protein